MSTQPSPMAHGIELSEVLPDAQPIGANRLVFRSACGKWDECEPGDLYVAISDVDCDGHDFSQLAVQRGAIGVVTERLLAIQTPQFIVDDTREAFGEICNALSGQPSQRMTTIGITGTAGKTVTAHLLESILKQSGRTVGLSSSIETRFGDTRETATVETTAPALAGQLSKMVIGGCQNAVLELSGTQLARRQYSGIQLDASVITNMQPPCMELHGNFDNYQNALMRSFEGVKPTGVAIVNADDRRSMKMLNSIQLPTLTFGIHQPAEISAKMIDRNRCFQTFLLSAGNELSVVRTSIIGKQHIYNCLAAATTALTLGVSLEHIVAGLESVSIPGRLERVDYGQDFGVWIDSAKTPTQLSGAIAAVSQVCDGKIWCIASTDPAQSKSDRRNMGAILERKSDMPVLTQSHSTKTPDFEPCHQVLDGFDDPSRAHVSPDRAKAIQWALSKAKPQDIVLIAGAGEKAVSSVSHPSLSIELQNTLTDRDICSACLAENSVECLPGSFASDDIYRIDDYR